MTRPDGAQYLVGAVAAVLFVAAIVPTGGTVDRAGPLGLVGMDLWLHALGYCLLQWVVLVAAESDSLWRVPTAATPLVVVGYGVLLELVQFGLAYRHASPHDALANALGALVALAGWTLLARQS